LPGRKALSARLTINRAPHYCFQVMAILGNRGNSGDFSMIRAFSAATLAEY
jgi:hypothetical protein